MCHLSVQPGTDYRLQKGFNFWGPHPYFTASPAGPHWETESPDYLVVQILNTPLIALDDNQ